MIGNRSLIITIGLLFLTMTAGAAPPADLFQPAPFLSVKEASPNGKAVGTVHILAVMVEFQEEDNRFTTGNGTFNLEFLHRDDIVIDPLPHDRGYFEAHLEFARNYFSTVSGGLLDIEYRIVPEIVQLDQPMSAYAPLGETGEENFKLAHLARDAWQKAGEVGAIDLEGFDPDRTMFIVFHAGSGRNIELMGTTLDKTPQDIPSVYLGDGSLQRLLEDPDFNGFDIGDPDIRVTNTALLPQTQSRSGEDVTGQPFVLELSINGLLAANIGSFLGLPDLFNTETGASAIGRFGLMDGASIFSYLGLFPPEPSAWEKMHLGWIEPFDIRLDTGEPIPLPAVSLHQPNSLARHAISHDEYFLVENRHRNPSGNPLEITIRTPDGSYVTRNIAPDDERFDPLISSSYDEILEPGVIVNVSSFDWSLPGGPEPGGDGTTGTDDDRLLNGGMLIWHIDEAVIRSTIDDNRVNADSDRRGVQLVEADGARDIGRQPGLQQNRFTNGHAFDFWWSGNDFTVITARRDSIVVYENRFGPDTRPSNHSNTGSPSNFEFHDFSDNIPEAWFYARSLARPYARPVSASLPNLPETAGFQLESTLFPVSPVLVTDGQDSDGQGEGAHLIIPARNGFFVLQTAPSPGGYDFLAHPHPTSPLIRNGKVTSGQFRLPETSELSNTSGTYTASDEPVLPQTVRTWSLQNGTWSLQWELEELPSGPGLISMDKDGTLRADLTTARIAADGSLLPGEDEALQSSGTVDGITASIHHDQFRLSDNSFRFDLDAEDRDSRRKYTGNLRFSGDSGPAFFILTDHQLMTVDRDGRDEWRVRPYIRAERLSWPAFGDFTGDHVLDIFITDREANELYGFNRDGGLLDFFPMRPPRNTRFTGSPMLADITGDGHQELITAVRDSLTMTIHAFDRFLDPIEGFPLTAGSLDELDAYVPLPLLIAGGQLVSVAPSGEVRAWELPELGEVAWGSVYGSQPGNKVGFNLEGERQQRAVFGILNAQETYNWPNPADDHTYIRFETSEPARIDINVIHPGGSIVYETQADSQGRFPQEVRINTSSWGSGVYFARLRANNGNNSETKMIKIVVTH
ncbi:MAG: T9SS type A sorting domain-containing protein [Cyclonatronaceae bacterium]